MKALLRKDWYQMLSQFKIFLVMIVIFCAIPSGSFMFFGVIYSVLMPSVSLMSMDETSKWDELSLMLPYSWREIVVEKYVLGWICLAGVLAFTAAAQALWPVLGVRDGFGKDTLAILCVYCATALVLQAVSSPINFRFGFTKGRIVNLIFIGVAAGIAGAASFVSSAEKALSTVRALTAHLHIATYPLLAAALCAASIPLSVRGYTKRVEK